LAAAGFGTAEGNAIQLGKALNDPIQGLSSLTESGVTFTAQEKKKIAEYVTPDLTELYNKIEVLDANTSKMTEYTNNIKNDLKQDVRRVESIVENMERSTKSSQRETDLAIKEIKKESDTTLKEVRRYSDQSVKEVTQELAKNQKETTAEIRVLRNEVDMKIQKALDNPLSK
jgi:hypothetical protein